MVKPCWRETMPLKIYGHLLYGPDSAKGITEYLLENGFSETAKLRRTTNILHRMKCEGLVCMDDSTRVTIWSI